MKNFLKLTLSFLLVLQISQSFSHDLKGALASEDRTPRNVQRDPFRNPYETLSFFGIESDMTVIELSPGGGWYTEILANYIHYPGTLIAAHFNADSDRAYYRRSRANFEEKVSNNPMYGRVEIVDLDSNLAEPETVDAVLTFRNLHNWLGPQMEGIYLYLPLLRLSLVVKSKLLLDDQQYLWDLSLLQTLPPTQNHVFLQLL